MDPQFTISEEPLLKIISKPLYRRRRHTRPFSVEKDVSFKLNKCFIAESGFQEGKNDEFHLIHMGELS